MKVDEELRDWYVLRLKTEVSREVDSILGIFKDMREAKISGSLTNADIKFIYDKVADHIESKSYQQKMQEANDLNDFFRSEFKD